jgi:hypothetical protein
MRYLTTLLLAALSLNAVGQGIPQLPYNPDATGDEFIGSPDLLELLSLYGEEFSSAIISEDQESAIVYMGEMAHPVCSQACDNLPGFWHMSTMNDLGLVWDEVDGNTSTWVNHDKETFSTSDRIYDYTYLYGGLHKNSQIPNSIKGCYCAAHELPKVEYSYCEGSDIQECAEDKVTNGWFPLNGVSSHHRYPAVANSYIFTDDYQFIEFGYPMKVQAFWRWAE